MHATVVTGLRNTTETDTDTVSGSGWAAILFSMWEVSGWRAMPGFSDSISMRTPCFSNILSAGFRVPTLFQVAPVGITAGRRLYWFAECGIGMVYVGGKTGIGIRF